MSFRLLTACKMSYPLLMTSITAFIVSLILDVCLLELLRIWSAAIADLDWIY